MFLSCFNRVFFSFLVSPGIQDGVDGDISDRRDDSGRSRHATMEQDYLDSSERSSSDDFKLHRRSDEYSVGGGAPVVGNGSADVEAANRSFDEYRGEAINLPGQLHGGDGGLNLRREVQQERLPATLGSRGISIPTQQHITSM